MSAPEKPWESNSRVENTGLGLNGSGGVGTGR